MSPCQHFHPLSSATGLDAEGVCNTCKAQWDLTDIEAATPRIIDHCLMCGPVRLSRNDIHPTRGKHGAFYTWDCQGCGNTIYKPLTPVVDFVLAVGGVVRKPAITDREVRDFLTDLGSDYIAAIAQREMTR